MARPDRWSLADSERTGSLVADVPRQISTR